MPAPTSSSTPSTVVNEKDGANTMILTSNVPANNWDRFFTEDDILLRTLNRLFDRA